MIWLLLLYILPAIVVLVLFAGDCYTDGAKVREIIFALFVAFIPVMNLVFCVAYVAVTYGHLIKTILDYKIIKSAEQRGSKNSKKDSE